MAPAILESTRVAERRPEPEGGWSRYVGRYRTPWSDSQVLILDGELVVINPTEPDPMPGLIKLIPVGEHVFRMQSKDGYLSHGELVVFDLDHDGSVVRMKSGENYANPIAAW